jgi:hypothetical protein
MELDELKNSLKTKLQETGDTHLPSELGNYIPAQSGSVIGKIKRNMMVEIIFCLFCLPLFAWSLSHYTSLYNRFFMGFGIIFCLATIAYLAILRKKIILLEASEANIRENLRQIIDIIGSFLRLYFQITMILLPVSFIAGIILGYAQVLSSEETVKSFSWSNYMLYYIGFFSAWCFIMYFFTKWYLKKLYGNYLLQLKEQLKELENNE